MKHNEYYWKSNDGLELFGQTWVSDKQPKAIINLLHEFGEHSGRYENLVQSLVENNYYVVSIDLRGHGRSSGKRGYSSSYQKLIKDLQILILKSENLFPDSPKLLFGIGLGGSMAIYFLTNHITNLSGLIVSSPWLSIQQNISKTKLLSGKIIRYILPGMIIETGFAPEDKMRSPDSISKFKNDPLNHDKVSVKLFYEIIIAGQRSTRSIYKINMPILVMHGNSDKIASFKASKNFILNASAKATLKLWDGYYHDLLNDEGSDEVCKYVISWLDKITGQS